MSLIAFIWGVIHTGLLLLAAPLVTGLVRTMKARLVGRVGPSPLQPYRDLWRLIRKESIVADTASPLFTIAPYLIFASVWLAAVIVPSFTTRMVMVPTADLIALVALLATSRFFTALAGMDVGTSFGGLGASREMMIASLAEPAMLMVTFSLSLLAGSTAPAHIIDFVLSGGVGLEVSVGLALGAIVMVAVAECGRIPIDNPATHLELTMVHEAMVLEYSGRHLALIELAGMVRLLLFMTLIASLFMPWGIDQQGVSLAAVGLGFGAWFAKIVLISVALAGAETMLAKMRVFRVADFLGGALLLGLLATIFLYVSEAV